VKRFFKKTKSRIDLFEVAADHVVREGGGLHACKDVSLQHLATNMTTQFGITGTIKAFVW